MKRIVLYTILMILGLSLSVHSAWWDNVDSLDSYSIFYQNVTGDPVSDGFGTGYLDDNETWSGYYFGTVSGNTTRNGTDVFAEISSAYYLELTGENFDSTFNYKVERPDDDGDETSGTDGDLTVNWNDDYDRGTWLLSSSLELGFYGVMGGNYFAMYFVNPFQTQGNWWTGHLPDAGNSGSPPAISHLAATGTAQVPEPTVMLLLGVGFAGIALFGRKRRGLNNT